jgi:hypothetical protein
MTRVSIHSLSLVVVAVAMLALLMAPALAIAQSTGEPGRDSDQPNPLNNVYFGEQHLHTVNSPDAFAFGTRNTPDDELRFCKGGPFKKSTSGEVIQKTTPYDWCAVTEHANDVTRSSCGGRV